MTTPSQRLADLGLELPAVAKPVAAYIPATRTGDVIVTSGQLPSREGALVATGKVGGEVSAEQATEAARVACLNAIAAAASLAGGVDSIKRVVKLLVFIASDPAFTAQPAVANGASTLVVDVFGEAGQHARSAVGVAVLPLDAPVEVELTVEV